MMDNDIDQQLIHRTHSLCTVCHQTVPATVVSKGHEVWMHKQCHEHGLQKSRLSTDADWYREQLQFQPEKQVLPRTVPVEYGCPWDCGLCELHEQPVKLPIITITSACNLACPKCYVHNKNEDAWHMSTNDFNATLDTIKQSAGDTLDLINLTGGDPTLHPDLPELVALCNEQGFHRVSVCTNGIRLVKEEKLLHALADQQCRIALSFDGFNDEIDIELNGAKLLDTKIRCLDLLEQHSINTTLITVMAKDRNETDLPQILQWTFTRPNIRHLELHTMTFTGPGGTTFDRDSRITLKEVIDSVCHASNGLLQTDDFVPSPCAHPLCYQIAYLLLDPEGGDPVPFTRFLNREELYRCLSGQLYLEPGPELQQTIRTAMERLWLDDSDDAKRILRILKTLIDRLFPEGKAISPEESLRRSEEAVKAIYIHTHMDEDNFDIARLAQCCDCNFTPDGQEIPVCAYNVLYRDKQAEFMRTPASWPARDNGIKELPVYVVADMDTSG